MTEPELPRPVESHDRRPCVREYALDCGAVGSAVDRARQPHLKINRLLMNYTPDVIPRAVDISFQQSPAKLEIVLGLFSTT